MNRTRYRLILIFSALIFVLLTILRLSFPSIVYINSGLVLLIFVTIVLEEDISTWIFAGTGLLLIGVTTVVSNHLESPEMLMAELFSTLVIALATILVLKVKKIYRSAKNERQQLNALFEFATEGVILTNQKGAIVLANPAALKLFGYSEAELIGRPVEVLLPDRVQSKHVHYRNEFHNNPSNRSMGHGRDLFARHTNGKEFQVEVSLSHFKQKNETYVIAFIVDITERKHAEKSLIEQKDQLENVTRTIKKLNMELETKVEERTEILKQALSELETSRQELTEALEKEKELSEIKSRFVSMASHEFRTPLTTVLSSASLIGKYHQSEEQDKRDKHIRRIKESVKHLNDLLEDFLSLGKLEEGKVQANVEQFSVPEFIQDLSEEMKAVMKNGQQLQSEHQGSEQFITDKKLLKNVLINLISNAIKFSQENGEVVIKTYLPSDELTVVIEDKGIGISEEDLQHLFTSFYRGKNALNIQGTGLGLHIVSRYLQLLNGSINVSSVLGEGTTVTVRLPRLEA